MYIMQLVHLKNIGDIKEVSNIENATNNTSNKNLAGKNIDDKSLEKDIPNQIKNQLAIYFVWLQITVYQIKRK